MSGSTIGTVVGGVVGAVLGWFVGNPVGGAMLGMSLGGGVGGYLDPPKLPHQFGPRLDDLKSQTATYGAFIPRIYGTVALYGNVFWIENNKLKEVAITETVGGKGSAPEGGSTTYKYYGTFAVGLCEGPIVGIRRIWISGKLWYNKGTVDTNTLVVSANKEKKFKLFLGTEDQMPAARMEADVGVGNCPAYRGLAYLLIHDLELTLYGNSLAGMQVKVEVIKNGAYAGSLDNKAYLGTRTSVEELVHHENYVYVVGRITTTLQVMDVSDPGNPILKGIADAPFSVTGIAASGNTLYVMGGSTKIFLYDIKKRTAPVKTGEINILTGTQGGIAVNGGLMYLCNASLNRMEVYAGSLLVGTLGGIINATKLVVHNGVIFANSFNAPTLYAIGISSPAAPTLISSVALSVIVNSFVIEDGFLYYTAGSVAVGILDISNPAAMTVVATLPTQAVNDYSSCITKSGNFVFLTISPNKCAAIDVSVPSAPFFVATGNLHGSHQFYRHASNGLYHYFASSNTENLRVVFFGNHIDSDTVTLSSIVQAECLQSRLLTAGDLDVSQLTQPVRGYRVSAPGAIRNGIEPLQGAWPFDLIQDGYKLKFVARGGAPAAAITHDKLDARGIGQSPGIHVTRSREMDSILPAKVTIKHIDFNREYDTGEQYYERINTDAVNMTDIELPVVLDAAEAAGKAQALCYLYWLERYDISFSLPPEYNRLQPADVVTLTAPDANYNLRIKQINYTSDGRLEIQAKYNQPVIYTPTTVLGSEGTPAVETLPLPGLSFPVFLDIPLLLEDNNVPGFPVAVWGSSPDFAGATLSRSDDGGQTYGVVHAFAPPGATVGAALNSLAAHPGTSIDSASVLKVRVDSGTLSSVTQAQMLGGSNFFAYGEDGRWEIIAAQNCALQGDGTYNFSNLLRGRYGTERNTGNHAANDTVVLLNAATVPFVKVATGQIGVQRDYLLLTSGAPVDDVIQEQFAYRGVNLECLSPVYLKGWRDPATNDWSLEWIRRSRTDEGWWPLLSAQLGEASESYSVEIYADSSFAAIKRTLLTTSPAATYTAADQATDFGGIQNVLYVKVYQNSAIVGAGFPLTQTVS